MVEVGFAPLEQRDEHRTHHTNLHNKHVKIFHCNVSQHPSQHFFWVIDVVRECLSILIVVLIDVSLTHTKQRVSLISPIHTQ